MADQERTPPQRIRLSGLQEVQIEPLVELDELCANQYWEIGFDAAEVPKRAAADFVRLTRGNDVYVAEADDVVAGFLAWADEAPGVAHLVDVSVHPEYQRFGVATKLLGRLHERARDANIGHVVARCWDRAKWAKTFYDKSGFKPFGDDAPAKVKAWHAERAASGRPVTRPGETLLWAAIPPPPVEDEEDPPPAM